MYYVWAVLLILACAAGWIATVFAGPGTWIIVSLAALFALLSPFEGGNGVTWTTVAVLIGLAVLGEIVEFAAGAVGAAKLGGSRRAMVLAIMGGLIGSMFGAAIGMPVPLIGSIVGAVAGGALGAFLGAFFGETWKGRTAGQSLAIGKAALIGRLFGTVGKMVVAGVMVVIVAVDALR